LQTDFQKEGTSMNTTANWVSQISQKPMDNTWMKPICADNHNTQP
jgi:hypothetical protein